MHDQDPDGPTQSSRTKALSARHRGDLDEALTHAQAALQHAFATDDPVAVAGSLDLIGDMQLRRGETDEARSAYAAALEAYGKLGSHAGQANVNLSLGHLNERLNDLAAARRHFHAALEGYRRAGWERGQAQVLEGLGLVALRDGQRAEAAHCYAAALEVFERMGTRQDQTDIRYRIAQLVATEDAKTGVHQLEALLDAYAELEDPLGIANVHQSLGRAKLELGDVQGAENHAREAAALYERTGARRGQEETQQLHDEVLERKRAQGSDRMSVDLTLEAARVLHLLSVLETEDRWRWLVQDCLPAFLTMAGHPMDVSGLDAAIADLGKKGLVSIVARTGEPEVARYDVPDQVVREILSAFDVTETRKFTHWMARQWAMRFFREESAPTQHTVRAGLGASVYLRRLGEFGTAFELLEQHVLPIARRTGEEAPVLIHLRILVEQSADPKLLARFTALSS